MTEENDRRYQRIMNVIAVIVVIEVLVLIFYPMMNMEEENLTIIEIEIPGDGLYHIKTEEGITLRVAGYYYDILIPRHTYLIKWMNGIRVDRIMRYEEVLNP